MPPVYSPPKGREYRKKNVHNLSRSSDEEQTPKKQKHMTGTKSIAEYFEKRDSLKARKDKKK